MTSPLVSVIVPVWNGERFLAAALDSIVVPEGARAEVIVVDDGSTDRSAAIAAAREPLVRTVRQEHAGLPQARNRGLAEAQGSLLAFLDADDLWSEDKLALQLEALKQRADVAIVLGRTRRMWAVSGEGSPRAERGGDTTPVAEEVSPRAERGGETTPLAPSGVTWSDPELALSFGAGLVRREVFEQVGRFDESYAYCDDWDWFMRAREMGVPIGVHSDIVLYYRRHEGNMTNDTAIGNHFFARMLRRSVERRRAGGTAPLPALLRLD
jgi:glycosyltransferase involved in cell wall biosynthesis